MTARDSVFVVGICGGSCSGKTTFARRLHQELGDELCALIYQDSYYIDQSRRFKEDGGDVNFDHPSSLDFDLLAQHLRALKQHKSIDVPIYNFVTHSRETATIPLESRPVIVVDGTLLLSQSVIRPELNHSVFLECDELLRFERRKRRDTQERGRQLDGVIKQFANHVKPMHDSFVEPSKVLAGTVISCPNNFETSFLTLLEHLKSIL